jgi:chromosome partitioning protein
LNEREAFRAMFSFRQPHEALSPAEVGNHDKAIANAEAFARDVVSKVRKKRAAKAANAGVGEPA